MEKKQSPEPPHPKSKPFRGGRPRSLEGAGGRVMDALSRTGGIEQAVEGLLCPMKMFMQLMEEGWTPAAWRMLIHDLGVKRVLITRQTERYVLDVIAGIRGR